MQYCIILHRLGEQVQFGMANIVDKIQNRMADNVAPDQMAYNQPPHD